MTSKKNAIKLRFDNLTTAEGGTHAAKLREELLDLQHSKGGEHLESVALEKDTQETMDFGTTLVLVLGTPAAVAIAKGIASYLSRMGGSVTVEYYETGKVEKVQITGLRGQDAARIMDALNGSQQQ